MTCDLPFIPAAAKSKCMGQENKWNDQHCQNVLVFEQILQSSTIRNNGYRGMFCCTISWLWSVGHFSVILYRTTSPCHQHQERIVTMGNLCFKLAETDICSLFTLAVYLWLQKKILSSIISRHFLFFFIMSLHVQIRPSRDKGFITINYYFQELNILL